MTGAAPSVLLCGRNSTFFEYASFHLAAQGIRVVPVVTDDQLLDRLIDVLRSEHPCLVLLHWDTLGDLSLRSCAYLKGANNVVCRPPVAILTERLHGCVDTISAFSSGADDLIEGALNPRILVARIRGLLGRRPQVYPSLAPAASG